MTKKQKFVAIFINVTIVIAIFGTIWGAGRIAIHDIPTIISGYDYVVIESEPQEDYRGVEREVSTKKAKRKITVETALEMLIEDAAILTLSVGFILIYFKDKGKSN